MNDISEYEFLTYKEEVENILRKNNISNLYISEFFSLLNDEHSDEDDYESISLRILNELVLDTSNSFYLKNDMNLIKSIRSEIYNFICTDSQKYSEARNKLKDGTKKLPLVLTNLITYKFGLETSIVYVAVSITLLIVFKIGQSSWCNLYTNTLDSQNNNE